ncbi:MAG TPA: winged helix DNA-binding domain-containing protein [Phycicoccus sp.]|nr:winged helix DNA-binding domain-containing protein [Phycicoccus sp.]
MSPTSRPGVSVISDATRRARIAVRQGLAADHRHPDISSATKAMSAWHSTEPASVHLGIAARTEAPSLVDVDAALYEERSLVKMLAMRRTVFAFPRTLVPAARASSGARVAAQTRTGLHKTLRDHAITRDPDDWTDGVQRDVLAALSDGIPLSSKEIGAAVPEVARRVPIGTGRSWESTTALTPQVLALLSASGHIMRGPNAGDWRRPAPLWTTPEHWLGAPLAPVSEREGYAVLVAAWLSSFGPGTEADLVWWLGSTKGAVRTALADIDAVPVLLEGDTPGWSAPEDDLRDLDAADVGPWAALLPALDPATMGWRDRAFYLDPAYVPLLFDSAGNGAQTAWVNGRIVGTWVMDDQDRVRVVLCDPDLRSGERALLDVEAERLATLLDGQRISSPYTSALASGKSLSP